MKKALSVVGGVIGFFITILFLALVYVLLMNPAAENDRQERREAEKSLEELVRERSKHFGEKKQENKEQKEEKPKYIRPVMPPEDARDSI